MQTESPFALEEVDTLEEQPTTRQPEPMKMWLGLLGLMILFILLYLVSNSLAKEALLLESELVPLQTALASSAEPLPQARELAITLTAVHQQTNQIASILPTLEAENVDWSAALAAVHNLEGSVLTLTRLEQVGDQLFISGNALSDEIVNEYAQALESSGQFSEVIIQSIIEAPEPNFSPSAIPPSSTPSPMPAATHTRRPTAVPTKVPVTPMPTWTPTPKLTDEFEWDDMSPKPIFVGAPAQAHNFYPNLDVDNAYFLAKAGRSYEVLTDFLAPGVDTFLKVSYGDVSLTNDDATLGTLSSSLIVQAPSDSDVEVRVEVTNRGIYGPDQWYDLQVVEVVMTTPTPTLTPTNAPPTLTPTPTQDLRDIYEPNDIDPSPIAIGESQIHNFFPNGDIDNVGFLVKNGRFYQILTSQLGVGVDTELTVRFAGQSWQNDDYDVPGSGNFASAVCFPAETDGTAVASITNVSQQFGPSKTYLVSVQEVPFLSLDTGEVDFGTVAEGSTGPITQTVQIEGTETLDWEVSTETPWLSTDIVTGTTPTTLNIIANLSLLEAGSHAGELQLGWADFCRQTVPVTIQVGPVQSSRPEDSGRPRSPVAKGIWYQTGEVEFVIVVTFK